MCVHVKILTKWNGFFFGLGMMFYPVNTLVLQPHSKGVEDTFFPPCFNVDSLP